MSRIRFAPLPNPQLCSSRDDDSDDEIDDDLDAETESGKNIRLLAPAFSLPAGKKSSDTSSIASSSISADSCTTTKRTSRFLRLFRLKDKENSLTRWPSNASYGSNAISDALCRTQSTTSYRGGNVRSPKSVKTRRSSTASDNLLATIHSARPSQRMLNGRVYGGVKDPFASAPDKEPEFVEWGYGGMGSVKSQREVGGRMWDKVQSEMGDGDQDDGGGMGWVKRRKEDRERKAREEAEHKEQQDKAQKEHDLRAVNVPMHEDENDDEDDDSPSEQDSPDDDEDHDITDSEARKTSLGAGVEKVSRHHKS